MGSEAARLQNELKLYTASLKSKGVIDEQFTQVQELQDDENPDFVFELVTIFYEDSTKIVNEMINSLGQEGSVDFNKLHTHVHQLKGSSSSIGAKRVLNASIALRSCCYEKNVEGCSKWLQVIKQECFRFRSEVDAIFKLEEQIKRAKIPGSWRDISENSQWKFNNYSA